MQYAGKANGNGITKLTQEIGTTNAIHLHDVRCTDHMQTTLNYVHTHKH